MKMKGFNLPLEGKIRDYFSNKEKNIITPSSVATTSSNNKQLDNLFIILKFLWIPIFIMGLFSLSILILSIL